MCAACWERGVGAGLATGSASGEGKGREDDKRGQAVAFLAQGTEDQVVAGGWQRNLGRSVMKGAMRRAG